jgi:Protein of unknown function (DUF1565)
MPPTTPLRRPAALAAAAMTILVLVLALATTASAAPAALNVDAVAGQDTNPGTATLPLKTLGTALKLAAPGATVKLAAGVYGPGFSGDQYPAGGLVVPSGVTVVGALSGGAPTATLLGPGSGVGLNLAGNATIRNLVWGGQGFGVGLYAKQGKQTLSNLFLATTTANAVIDGAQFSAGILLRGTAQASSTASTLFVNARTGASVQQLARLTLHGGQLNLADGADGVFVGDQGRLTMDGGKISGGAPNCGLDSIGIEVRDAAQATLQNGTRLENVPGFGLFMNETAKATLNGATISREATAGCGGRASIDVRGSASLTTDGATIAAVGGQDVHGIATHGTATLLLKNTDVQGHTGIGIDLNENEKLTIEGGSVRGNAIGVEARTVTASPGTKNTPHITMTGASVSGNGIGVQVDEPILKLRDSKVIFNQTGIEIRGAVGGIAVGDTCVFACVNIGFGGDPGNNNFTANAQTAVRFVASDRRIRGVASDGNIWNANTQGANGDGLYPTAQLFTSRIPSPLNHGTNFELPNGSDTLIEFGPTTRLRLRLAPAVVHARAGKTARLAMSWTHPRSWRELRSVELRLYRGGKAVGTIAVRPRGARLSAFGAIALVPGRSRLTHRGKTVTARLALRLTRSVAGADLRVAVKATDRKGHQQLAALAGVIHVAP